MRYVILIKATADTEAGALPTEDLAGPMADFHEEMVKAGVLVDGNGLKPTRKATDSSNKAISAFSSTAHLPRSRMSLPESAWPTPARPGNRWL